MRHEDFRDPTMDPRSPAAAAWERSLRPAGSSGGVWLLLGIAVAAGLIYALVSLWPGAGPLRSADERQAAPATPSPAADADAPRQSPRSPSVPGTPPRTQRFAKCTSAQGAVTYSDGACPAGTRAAEVTVNPDINLADGMSREERLASMQDNRAAARALAAHERQVAMNVDTPGWECAHLKALIESIDAAARQPLPASEQDRLKDQRRRAHDRRFALRCG